MSAQDEPTEATNATDRREGPSRNTPSSPRHPDGLSVERLAAARAPSRDAMLALYL